MGFVNGKTYRFTNRYFPQYALNVYGTNAASTGRNVCLFKDDDTDIMQDWVVKQSGTGHRLHSAVNQSYVLDCSDGSLSNSYKNNAHLCATSQTTTTDSQVEFKKVDNNVYKIYLPGKNLYLTATNTNTPVSSSIANATALKGGTGGASNVYWVDEDEVTSSKKLEWTVSPEVDGGSTPDPEPSGKLTLAQLKAKFPNGKYWNHVGMSGNNQDSYTNTPCPSHNDESTCNHYMLNGVKKASQCQGFVMKCGYDAYGSDPYTWKKIEDTSALNNLKPGDIVRYYSNYPTMHSIFVTAVSGDIITFGDCNSDSHCKIRWGATTTKQKLVPDFLYVLRAPFTLK